MKKCVKCGKEYSRQGNTKMCPECQFLSRHKKCIECGDIFVAPEGYIGIARRKCFKCDPVKDGGNKKVSAMDQEIINAKKAGMTYGHYQEWKYKQQFRTNKMIKNLNKEINE